MPLKPMSATWNRAQELGQPLTLIVMGVSKSGCLCSISSRIVAARPFVWTRAS
jgi:hypothetical protein